VPLTLGIEYLEWNAWLVQRYAYRCHSCCGNHIAEITSMT
jgi:hypothetical protein